jgi:hypothetical protein
MISSTARRVGVSVLAGLMVALAIAAASCGRPAGSKVGNAKAPPEEARTKMQEQQKKMMEKGGRGGAAMPSSAKKGAEGMPGQTR